MSLTAETNFDADQALLSSTLSEMIVQVKSSKEVPTNFHAVYSMLRFLGYEQNMECMEKLLTSTYVPALKTIMARIWHNRDLFDSPEDQKKVVTKATDRVCAMYNLEHLESFFYLR